jgi:hypothetical protein
MLYGHGPAGGPRVLQDLLERLAADVLHHDVPGRLARATVRLLDEVIYPNDIGVLHLSQELPLGHGGRHGIRVPGIQQPLQYHPAVADVAVARQVDPAEPAEGEAAEHLVLPGHQLAGRQLRGKREPGAAVPAEPLGQARPAVSAPPDGLLAAGAKAPVLRHLRVGEHGTGRVAVRHGRDLHQAGPELPARGPAAGPPGPPAARGPAADSRPRSRARGRRTGGQGHGGRC